VIADTGWPGVEFAVFSNLGRVLVFEDVSFITLRRLVSGQWLPLVADLVGRHQINAGHK
jgi:hypothetical protein